MTPAELYEIVKDVDVALWPTSVGMIKTSCWLKGHGESISTDLAADLFIASFLRHLTEKRDTDHAWTRLEGDGSYSTGFDMLTFNAPTLIEALAKACKAKE